MDIVVNVVVFIIGMLFGAVVMDNMWRDERPEFDDWEDVYE